MILNKTWLYSMIFNSFIWNETSPRLKKYATLLPKNWLAETPQTLALMRLGRQSAERERISEIHGNFYQRKKVGNSHFFEFVYSLKEW
ncbi:hypothetical protein [Peribacillus simplex]|uniref:hypothetical protein n=1 Tax=Peribacillus simplex TaxID=1478 RepID=UPI003D293A75